MNTNTHDIYKPRNAKCHECGKGMRKKHRCQKYHPSCRKIVLKRQYYDSKVRTGKNKNPGVGRGANLQPGEGHNQWQGGGNVWQIKTFRGTECERCGSGGQMHLHHRDRDRTNWKNGNLETLCVPCHQEEHKNDKGLEYYAAA